MATGTLTLSSEGAATLRKTLDTAGDVVVALEWICRQPAESSEMAGVLAAVRALGERLDVALIDTAEQVKGELAAAGA